MNTTIPFPLPRLLRVGSIQWGVAVSVALLSWPLVSDAMSLGRSRGAAVLGRSLDISVLVSLEPQEEVPEAGCFNAELFYGDNRVSGASVTPLRTSPTELTLRVRASAPVDEPFVTLYMRASCSQSVSRRYVLLSDAPSEPAPPAALPALPLLGAPTPVRAQPVITELRGETGSAAQDPVALAAERAALRAGARQERLRQVQPPKALDPQAQEKAQARRQARQEAKELAKAQARARVVTRAEGKPARSAMSSTLGSATATNTGRLKVDLLDLVPGRDPVLRGSAELLSQPSTDPAARSRAAAMWRMINASPQDLLRDVERLRTLETEVRAMSDLTKRQTQELSVAKTELASAQNQRYANPFTYALAALCVGALAFAVWMWRLRKNINAPWWGNAPSRAVPVGMSKAKQSAYVGNLDNMTGEQAADNEREMGFVAASKLVTPPSSAMPLGASAGTSASARPAFVSSRRVGLDFGSNLTRRSGSSSRYTEAGVSDFDPNPAGGARPVNAEELFDIQQQADFFMSLGQHAQAIDILQNHISDNVETSALAYLDLFDIYHKIAARDEFEELREEFNRVFNAQVPEYEQYGLNSKGLEDYLPALERIQALWPSAKVLEVIEESIFRKPDRDNQPFDLLAYRELMLLYAVAKDVSEEGEAGLDPNDASDLDFDVSQPGDLMNVALSGFASKSAGRKYPSFSGTEVQPLSGAVADPAYSDNLSAASLDSEWEEALKSLPRGGDNIGVDIDISVFPDEPAPVAAPVTAKFTPDVLPLLGGAEKAPAKEGADNIIEFDIGLDDLPSPAKKPKS